MASVNTGSTELNILNQDQHGRNERQTVTNRLFANLKIPYAMLNQEAEAFMPLILAEMTEISELYNMYRNGVKFETEASGGNYVPSMLRYKKGAQLINKQARFMFSQTPDIVISLRGDAAPGNEEAADRMKNDVDKLQEMVNRILEANNFQSDLIKAAKDCFIGKRVAAVVNFNETDGINIRFVPSLNFLYEFLPGTNILNKFIMYDTVIDSDKINEKRIWKKKYWLEVDENGNNVCYLSESIYDGAGRWVEDLLINEPLLFDRIPAYVFVNDGLTGDQRGESEMLAVSQFEKYYSKLSNADMDSARKNMHPITYALDMESTTTKNLPRGPGSFWDLSTDQSAERGSGKVGILESRMAYSNPLTTTLDRIKSAAHDMLEIPDIGLENMTGVITSGKALKAIYWPLIVRCDEKLKTWSPGIKYIVNILIDGARLYNNTARRYTNGNTIIPIIDYEIQVIQNYPLPEDEAEEKNIDLSEVAAGTMSRKSYMMKWRSLSDTEAEAELQQMFKESQMENNMHLPPDGAVTTFENEGISGAVGE